MDVHNDVNNIIINKWLYIENPLTPSRLMIA